MKGVMVTQTRVKSTRFFNLVSIGARNGECGRPPKHGPHNGSPVMCRMTATLWSLR